MTTATHRVTWSAGHPTFHCDGDSTSSCHIFPDCECETWTAEHDENHPRVPHADACWILPWLENIEVECTWVGGEGYHRPAEHDAEISTEFDEQVVWDYADAALAVPE